jgi:hypothetical protein
MALFEDVLVELGVRAAQSLILQQHGPGPCPHCNASGKCRCSGCHPHGDHTVSVEPPAACAVCGGTGNVCAPRVRRKAG